MRLTYTSQVGHYNLLNPQEESMNCFIRLVDDGGGIIQSKNIKVEYELEGTDVDEAIYALEDYLKRVWTSSRKKDEEFIKFLKDNQDEIEMGNRKYRLEMIEKELEKLQKEKELLLSIK